VDNLPITQTKVRYEYICKLIYRYHLQTYSYNYNVSYS